MDIKLAVGVPRFPDRRENHLVAQWNQKSKIGRVIFEKPRRSFGQKSKRDHKIVSFRNNEDTWKVS